jgi:NAD-dependent deacetylase sirtuin 5
MKLRVHSIDSCLEASPNAAHKSLTHLLHPSSLAKLAPKQHETGSLPLLVTQNIDALSTRILEDASLPITFSEEEKTAAKERIFEMHGNIFVTQCTDCRATKLSYDKALCKALANPEKYAKGQYDELKVGQLPRCGGDEWNGSNRFGRCGGLLRPDVVWFGEIPKLMGDIARILNWCDMLIVVGTSSTVGQFSSRTILS